MNMNYRKFITVASCKDWTAEIKEEKGLNAWQASTWHAVLKFRDGSTRGFIFADEKTMVKSLEGMSKSPVKFARKMIDPFDAADAKQTMIESGQGRRGLGELRNLQSPNSLESEYGKDAVQLLRDSIWKTFCLVCGCNEGGEYLFYESTYNTEIMLRAMKDFEVPFTHENLRECCVWCTEQHFLQRPLRTITRKRGEPLPPENTVLPYKSYLQILSEEQDAAKRVEIQRAMALRKLPLDQIRAVVREQFPGIRLEGSRDFRDSSTAPPRLVKRAVSDVDKQAEFESLQEAERARQADNKAKQPKKYEW